LEAEGWARETVNRIQNLRKDSGLEITDRIRLWIQAPEALLQALLTHADWISSEVLAVELEWNLEQAPANGTPAELDVEGITFQVVLTKG
jgi:isoleucyl-tRNA synthetase